VNFSFKHLMAHARPFKEYKMFILLNGHTTYSKNLDVINWHVRVGCCYYNYRCYNYHTTHCLQPLSQFSNITVILQWGSDKITKPILLFWDNATCLFYFLNLKNSNDEERHGFKATNIWPVDYVFKNIDFVAAETLMPENCRSPENEGEEEKKEINIIPAHSTKNNQSR